SRQTPFSAVIAGLTPFLVSRRWSPGLGRVGIGPSGDEPGFQCRSAPTTSRSRWGWKPRSSAASSTPETNRTPTPIGTAGCT
ncbi:proteasome accessory factor PafA2 family protein, partial [Mycolicibacterium vaccae]|nr:proteasome accessory factor PafA2 family protein [Mycolicibacterium vaccae]